MNLSLKYKVFYKKYAIKSLVYFRNPKVFKVEDLELPIGSIIHWIPEVESDIGPTAVTPLLIRSEGIATIYHVETLIVTLGKAVKRIPNNSNLSKQYHKSNVKIHKVKQLAMGVSRNRLLLVLNYGFLNHQYKYSPNNMSLYNEWFNLRDTMWNNIAEIGSDRVHLVKYTLPKELPTKAQFQLYLNKMSVAGLKVFNTNEALNLLELFRMINGVEDSPLRLLTDDQLSSILLVFIIGGQSVTINLLNLVSWSRDDLNSTVHAFYSFMDSVFSIRSSIETTKVITESESVEYNHDINNVGEAVIINMVREQASIGRLSAPEQKALIKLSGKYKHIPHPFKEGTTLGDTKVTKAHLTIDSKPVIKDAISIHDKSMLSSRVNDLDELYIKKVYHNDIINMILSIQRAGFIVKDLKVKNTNTAVTESEQYSIQVQPVNGLASTVTFMLPTLSEEGSFFVAGKHYRMTRQRNDLPVAKIKGWRVGLTSYYGKIFIVRNQNSSNNYEKWMNRKLLARFSDDTDNTVTNLVYGIGQYRDYKLPRVYTAIGTSIAKFTSGKYKWNWQYENATKDYTAAEIKSLDKAKLYPCGRTTGVVLGMSVDNLVYAVSGNDVTLLGTVNKLVDPSMGPGPTEYTEISIYSKRIPMMIGFMLIYGLNKTLDLFKIEYVVADLTAPVPREDNVTLVKFKDVKYIITTDTQEHSLVIGGLHSIRKISKQYTVEALSRRSSYNSIASHLGLTQMHLRELELMFDMFIDPITYGLLEDSKLPTTFTDLLIHANTLLTNDYVEPNPPYRIKGYERVAGIVYNEFINSIRTYRGMGRVDMAILTMDPKVIWRNITSDQTIGVIHDGNPFVNLKEKEAVTFAGVGGRSGEVMVKSTRGFHEEDLGVISESSPDSAMVGVRTFMSANPNINSLRGTTDQHDNVDSGPTNYLSTSALTSPAASMDDSKRVNFISIQNAHNVGSFGHDVPPFRTGYEQVIANRVDKMYASTAKLDGKVTSVSSKYLKVVYNDGSKDSFRLGVVHGTSESNTSAIPHMMVTDLTDKSTFKAQSVLVWNRGFFDRDLINPDAVSYRFGAVARIAMLESMDTIEDGCVLTQRLADRLSVNTTHIKFIVVDNTDTVHDLVKVGDVLNAESILCTIEPAITADLSESEKVGLTALTKISNSNPKAKYDGVVSNIEVLHFVNKTEPSKSIASIIESDNKRRASLNSALGTKSAKTGDIDESIFVAGKKLAPGQVVIKIYLDDTITAGTGDKVVFVNQLKATVSRVETNNLRDSKNIPIDGLFGYISIQNRIVLSPELMGTVNTVMATASKQMAEIYFKG